uniref:S24/S26 family peptidase n=1 Tax=Thaumasiovibrio occultus TaxID=1891184 RepID=UPI00131A7C62|nr:S24/S26 family peptidase [Thaumasiovibrio occultus]
MLPSLRCGDFVLLACWKTRLLVGDDVVVEHPHYGRIVKRIASVDGEQVTLTGTHASSVSSAQMGAIARSAIVGKVVYRITRS